METLISYFAEDHDKLLYVLAGVSLLLELTVTGVSGILLFFAIACVLTGLLVSFGLINGWEVEVLLVAVFSLLSAVLLFKPLKKFQGTTKSVNDDSSDLIGQTVAVSETVTQTSGSIRHSGINWQARLSDTANVTTLEASAQVVIIAVQGTLVIVDEK
jgi:membrane protein implicated in regulation of membrane protease activity